MRASSGCKQRIHASGDVVTPALLWCESRAGLAGQNKQPKLRSHHSDNRAVQALAKGYRAFRAEA